MKTRKYILNIISTLLLLVGLIFLFIPSGVEVFNLGKYPYFSKEVFLNLGFIPSIVSIGTSLLFIASIVNIFINNNVLKISIYSFLVIVNILSYVFIAQSKTIINYIQPIFLSLALLSYLINLFLEYRQIKNNKNE